MTPDVQNLPLRAPGALWEDFRTSGVTPPRPVGAGSVALWVTTLVVVGAVFGVVNTVVRPVVGLLPLTLVVGVVSWLLALLVPERRRHRV